jgi:hypothetical protein
MAQRHAFHCHSVKRSNFRSYALCVTIWLPRHDHGDRALSLGAARKRIIHFDTTDKLLSVEAASSARRAQCPTCLHGGSRRHGQYWRQLLAQPCMGRSVNLSVQLRRFKCINPQCSRTNFVELIDGQPRSE